MSRARWVGIMFDRFGLIIPRLVASGADIGAETPRSLAALQIGLDLMALKQSAVEDMHGDHELSRLMPMLSHSFRWLARGNAELRPDDAHALLTAIDSALSVQAGERTDLQKRQVALTGLRRTLFPHAHALSSSEVIR
jgi:hypothetical protein